MDMDTNQYMDVMLQEPPTDDLEEAMGDLKIQSNYFSNPVVRQHVQFEDDP